MDIIKELFLWVFGIAASVGLMFLVVSKDKEVRKVGYIILGLILLGAFILGFSQ